MRIALDTNRYTDAWSGDPIVTQNIEDADEVFLPFVVVAELRQGFLKGSRQAENERRLREFLGFRHVRMLFADEATTLHYATLYHQLRLQGTPIPTHDIWIAALALEHGLTLYAARQALRSHSATHAAVAADADDSISTPHSGHLPSLGASHNHTSRIVLASISLPLRGRAEETPEAPRE